MIKRICFIICVTVSLLFLLEISLRIYANWYKNKLTQQYKTQSHDKKQRLKILAVGESTTAGLWVEDKSYPIQLKKLLETHYSCKGCVDIQITDLPGGNSSASLHSLPPMLISYKPDLVIFLEGYNDVNFYDYNIDALLLEDFFIKNKTIYAFYLKFVNNINEIRIFRIAKLALVSLTMPKEQFLDTKTVITNQGAITSERKNFLFYQPNITFIFQQIGMNLEKMIEIVKINNATPILMTYHIKDKGVNEIIRSVAKKKNVYLIDNELVFAKLPRFEDYIFTKSPAHPNALGYKIIAENVMKNLLQWKLVE